MDVLWFALGVATGVSMAVTARQVWESMMKALDAGEDEVNPNE